MYTHPLPILFCTIFLAACASAPSSKGGVAPEPAWFTAGEYVGTAASPAPSTRDLAAARASAELQQQGGGGRWREGEVALQGYFGANTLEVGVDGGRLPALQDNDETFAAFGGGAQLKLSGKDIDIGVEGMLEFSGAAGAAGFAAGGGGAAVYVDFDVFLFQLYGGPFLSLPMGDRARLYGAAGPMMQWAFYEQDSAISALAGDGSGFGYGYYARTGLEFGLSPRMMFGVSVRWSETEADLDGGFGDLQLEGFQWAITVTQGF